jgi:hypothetical protein
LPTGICPLSRCRDVQAAGAGFRRGPDRDLDVLAHTGQPARQPVNRHALHPPMQHLRQGRPVGAANFRRLFLVQRTAGDTLLQGQNKRGFGRKLFGLGRGEAHVHENVAASVLVRDVIQIYSP